jgi:hypothetical protein
MDPFADPSDIASVWRPLTDAEISVVYARIDQASQMVRDEVPDVDDRVTAGSLAAATVRDVVVAMVRRVMVNPDGDSSVTEQTGPFSVTRTRSRALAAGELYINASELARLTGRRATQRAFTISPGVGPVFS